MTPPDHLLTGLSIGAFYSSICGFFSFKRFAYIPAIFLCGIFAMLPDADALRGVYSSTDIFTGHRGITHSLFFVLSAAVIFTILYILIRKLLVYKTFPRFEGKKYLWIDLCVLLFLSGLSHLVMDLPQPPGVWKGIPLFFPLKDNDIFVRSGGWSCIGWYDYRITWILFVTVSISFVFLIAGVFFERRVYCRRTFSACIIIIFVLAGIMTTDHIMHSKFNGSREWNESQRRYIEDSPEFIKSIISKSRKLVFGFIR